MMTLYQRVAECQRKAMCGALRRNKGNQIAAAEELGIHRNTLSRLLVSLCIDVTRFIPAGRAATQRIARKRWRKKNYEKGLCMNCGVRPRGGVDKAERERGGTDGSCAECAKKKRLPWRAATRRLEVRCQQCSLKQFITASGQCRRCHKPAVYEPPSNTERNPVQGVYQSKTEKMMALSERISALKRQGAQRCA